jgi:hypothetical protein
MVAHTSKVTEIMSDRAMIYGCISGSGSNEFENSVVRVSP